MEILKLISIRVSELTLDKAKAFADNLRYYSTSDVLRVAIWIGLKFLKPGILHVFLEMMWQEEINKATYTPRDVIHAAGEELEKLKSEG